MNSLNMGFYGEGRRDERFLPIIIERTAERILNQSKRVIVDISPVAIINHEIKRIPDQAHRILEAAQRAFDLHCLIVHADADSSNQARALHERINPGRELVRQAKEKQEQVCDTIIPIVPIRMTEAWMLADGDALRDVIGSDKRVAQLGLPKRPHQVESVNDPKQELDHVIQQALGNRSKRHRKIDQLEIYEPLAAKINLEKLERVPAYSIFQEELHRVLVDLHLAN